MRFALTEEQESVRDVARSFLAEVPRDEDGGPFDAEVWARIVEEQGWPAIVIPEAFGGWGFTHMELGMVFEELGRSLVATPLLATVLATEAVLLGGSEAQKEELLGEIAGGTMATLAWEGDLRARRDGGGWLISGEALRVLDGHTAERMIVATSEGLFLVDVAATERSAVPALDASRPIATVVFRDVAVSDTARLPAGDLEATLHRARVLLACEQVGAADAVMDLAVEYAKVRKQFGTPIGSFQAIQHKCADMLLRVESARSAAWAAAWTVDAAPGELEMAARIASSYCGDALVHCAGESIQIHGGIGFTWEHACHLYFKRARASLSLFGHPREHRDALAMEVLSWT